MEEGVGTEQGGEQEAQCQQPQYVPLPGTPILRQKR